MSSKRFVRGQRERWSPNLHWRWLTGFLTGDGECFSFDLLVSLAVHPLHVFLTLNSGGRLFAGSYNPWQQPLLYRQLSRPLLLPSNLHPAGLSLVLNWARQEPGRAIQPGSDKPQCPQTTEGKWIFFQNLFHKFSKCSSPKPDFLKSQIHILNHLPRSLKCSPVQHFVFTLIPRLVNIRTQGLCLIPTKV